MAIGQILTIPNLTAQLVVSQSRESVQSLAMLNPNDGVVYIKLNGPAGTSPAAWDWKLPSQSYGRFPGPWQSLGVYYVDQSGSGRTAELNVYDGNDKFVVPVINSIGRAVQVSGSTMDVTQGTQPTNPALGTVRLWVDGNSDLHILNSAGVDNLVYDSSNIGTVSLGGDLAGTIGTATIILRNNSVLSARDTSNTRRDLLLLGGDNNVYFSNAGNGIIRFVGQTGTDLARIDNAGGFVAFGGIQAVGTITSGGANGVFRANAGSLYIGGPSGVVVDIGNLTANASIVCGGHLTFTIDNREIRFIDGQSRITSANRVMYFDEYNGGWIWRNSAAGYAYSMTLSAAGGLNAAGPITANGQLNLGPTYGVIRSVNGALYIGGQAGGVIIDYPPLCCAGQFSANSTAIVHGSYCISLPNASGTGSQVSFAYVTWSSLIHADQFKLRKEEVPLPISKVLQIPGYSYDHLNFDGDTPQTRDGGELVVTPTYGFHPAEVAAILPELVGLDENGEPETVDMNRMIVVLWEAFREYVTAHPK